ncbi:MAG: hypothetical protein QOE40_2830 [Actinomycetota bacterium]|jgi:hypothetical protein|nr:hypothetical protein [Actinomycetota bacterium]
MNFVTNARAGGYGSSRIRSSPQPLSRTHGQRRLTTERLPTASTIAAMTASDSGYMTATAFAHGLSCERLSADCKTNVQLANNKDPAMTTASKLTRSPGRRRGVPRASCTSPTDAGRAQPT